MAKYPRVLWVGNYAMGYAMRIVQFDHNTIHVERQVDNDALGNECWSCIARHTDIWNYASDGGPYDERIHAETLYAGLRALCETAEQRVSA